jgi:hypothetical protein
MKLNPTGSELRSNRFIHCLILRRELVAQFVVIERLIIPILTNVSVLETLAVFGVT